MRTPFVVMAVLVVALVGVWFATDDGGEAARAPAAAPVEAIAERVEALRNLRFESTPKPVEVKPGQARREGLSDFDRQYPPARRHADEDIYAMLGVVEPGVDLRELVGSLFGEGGIAGYYDPRDGRLRVVAGAGTGTRVLEEMVLAHELTHALEDQRFGLPTETAATDDRILAESALHEGTATALMYEYVQEHFSAEETLGGLLGAAFQDAGDLPPFLETQVVFPYLAGERFVSDLRKRAGGRWALVDTALRLRPPSSTEQVLHPRAYFRADEPRPVRLRVGAVLGPGWKRARAGTWGELQTRELLGGAAGAAAGWGGDRYELWRGRGDVLVMRWRWDTPRDEAEFFVRLADFVPGRVRGRAAVVRQGGAVTLVLAPSAALARRIAEGA